MEEQKEEEGPGGGGLSSEEETYEAQLRIRVEAMLDAGWVEEAVAIRGGCGFGPTAEKAIGYQEVLSYADGALERSACVDEITLRTRQFARKQRTWYRKFNEATWIEHPGDGAISDVAAQAAVDLGLS